MLINRWCQKKFVYANQQSQYIDFVFFYFLNIFNIYFFIYIFISKHANSYKYKFLENIFVYIVGFRLLTTGRHKFKHVMSDQKHKLFDKEEIFPDKILQTREQTF